jgi:hypothetical protein
VIITVLKMTDSQRNQTCHWQGNDESGEFRFFWDNQLAKTIINAVKLILTIKR